MIRLAPIALSILVATLAASCAPPPEKAPPASPPPAKVTEDLGTALTHVDDLAVRLGMTGEQIVAAVDGTCAPRSRYDGGQGPAGELVCFLKAERGTENRVLHIALSKPALGHRAWRIEYNRRRGEGADSSLIADLKARYGAPVSVYEPLEIWWRDGARHLRVIGEANGLRLQVWDRTFNGESGPGA